MLLRYCNSDPEKWVLEKFKTNILNLMNNESKKI